MHLSRLELSPQAVQERFAWALRRGHPFWLWPEVTTEKWQVALSDIEGAARGVLTEDRATAVLGGDAGDVGIAAFTSGMGPLLGFWAATGALEAEPAVRKVLKLHFAHNVERMSRLSKFSVEAVNALSDAGVETTVLKGMHTAHSYFPVAGSRPVSDIDLWIKPSDLERAKAMLRMLNYSPQGKSFGEQTWKMAGTPDGPCSLSLVHRDGPWSIDLHTTLDRRYSAGAPMVYMDKALQAETKDDWPLSPSGKVLTGPALVLHLAFHASLGLASMSMLRLAELVFVIRHLEARSCLSWDDFLKLAGRTGNPSCTYPALALVNLMAPGTAPEWVVRILRQGAPEAVSSVIAALSPATCQRVTRCSFQERFMWTATLRGWLREFACFLLPLDSPATHYQLWKMRLLRIVNGTIARRNP